MIGKIKRLRCGRHIAGKLSVGTRLVQLISGFVGTKQKEKAQKQVCAFVFNGDPGGIRTPDPRLRRPLLYPTELLNHKMERAMGIEPTTSAWKAEVLPLNYTRDL